MGRCLQTLFENDREGEGVFINPQSILTMHMEKAEDAWSELRSESKAKNHHFYEAFVRKVMVVPGNAAKMLTVRVRKPIDCARIHLITRDHQDLELLI